MTLELTTVRTATGSKVHASVTGMGRTLCGCRVVSVFDPKTVKPTAELCGSCLSPEGLARLQGE